MYVLANFYLDVQFLSIYHAFFFPLKVTVNQGITLCRVDPTSDGESEWMNEWTVFYWSWWIAWSPFVGAFIAKISRGRTIREFIHGSLTAPVLFSFLWITVFGGSGIKMERAAAHRGLCCPNWNLTDYALIPAGSIHLTFLIVFMCVAVC